MAAARSPLPPSVHAPPTMNDFSRSPRVLVVEDDEDIAQALKYAAWRAEEVELPLQPA